jgi:catechol 2,3-dioxygenase-like lactoylglutathione lyase family enzyme
MSEPVQHLLHIAPVLRVVDLKRSLEFYRDRLRFQVEFVYQDSYAEVRRDGCRIHFQCGTPTPRDQTAFEAAEHIDVCIVVRDASHLWAEFSSKGVPAVVSLRQMPYGREFYVRDPDGYVLGFVEPEASVNNENA